MPKKKELESEELEEDMEVEEDLDDEHEEMGEEPEEMEEPKPTPKKEKELSKDELTTILKSAQQRLDKINQEEKKENFLKELPTRLEKIEKAITENQKIIKVHHEAIIRLKDDFKISNDNKLGVPRP